MEATNEKPKTLVIGENEVRELLSMRDTMDAVEGAFREKGLGRVQMPPKIYVDYKKYNGDLRVMPSYLENLDLTGVKIVNVHPENHAQKMPSVMATILLLDPKNGFPLAVMGGTWITAMRTGAVGGVAAKYLARRSSEKVGFIGAGVQALTQLMALREVVKFSKVHAWSKAKEPLGRFKKEVGKFGIDVVEAGEPEGAARGMDIVVTTTPSTSPIVKSEWISEGTHINAIGADAPGKEELEPSILTRAKIVVDDWKQASHSGEINVPLANKIITRKNIHAELGHIVAGKKKGRTNDTEITVFDSTGLSIQDVATANIVYNKIKNNGARDKEVELVL